MLTDEELTGALRDAFSYRTEMLSPAHDLAGEIRRQHRRRHRAIIAGWILIPGLVVVLGLAGAIDSSTSNHPLARTSAGPSIYQTTGTTKPSGRETSVGSRVTLDGYIVVMPSGYTVRTKASALENPCIAELHLNLGEHTRVIKTPSDQCPLFIVAVSQKLPAGTIRQTIPGTSYEGAPAPQSVIWYDNTSVGQTTSYFPAKLPNGDTVFVSFLTGSKLVYQQTIELANGLEVARATSQCAGPCG